MLDVQNIRKTFNPGTVNEKAALRGVSLTDRKSTRLNSSHWS